MERYIHVDSMYDSIKISILLKDIYRLNLVLIRIPMVFFAELEKSILKYIESQGIPNSQNNLIKIEQSSRFDTSWFQNIMLSYNSQQCGTGITNQHNRMSPEINSCLYAQINKYWLTKHAYVNNQKILT